MDETNVDSVDRNSINDNVEQNSVGDYGNESLENGISENTFAETENVKDIYDEDVDGTSSSGKIPINDFGNVTDEDYDTENDKDSMRTFYVVSITVLCIFVLLVGLIVANRLFPDFISFSDDVSDEQTKLDSVMPYTENSDDEKSPDDVLAQDGEVQESDGVYTPDSTDTPDNALEENNSTTSVDGTKVLSVTEIYKSCVNSVVGITTEGTTTNIFGQVSKNASSGTGIVYSSDGYILTNYHVVESGSVHTVTLYSGESYKAELVGYEAANDVALLKINATGLSNAYIGSSDSISVGEDVVVIGNPLGELTYTLTRGVISALNRVINTDSVPKNMFQIDAAVNSGNSGGPAFDAFGRVIGIVTAKYSADTIEGIGFCIPINDAVNIAEELKKYGYVRGKSGLEICADDGMLTYNGFFTLRGALVTFVEKGGAAEKSGITTGDMIVEVNGTSVYSASDLQTVLRAFTIGDKVDIVAYHSSNGKTYEQKQYTVTLGEYSPHDVPNDYSTEKYGFVM